jgi:cytochrome c oxidase subunit II
VTRRSLAACLAENYKRGPMKNLIGLLVAAVTVSTALSNPIVRAQEPKRVEITAKRFTYEPAEITLKKGEPVVLVIKSLDVTHGLRLRELNVDTKIPVGTPQEVKLTPQKTGNFVAHCSVFCGPGHGSMALKVHVVQ